MEADEQYARAKKRVQNLKAFYIHLTVYILVNMMLFSINVLTDASNWWFIYPLGGWGFGVVIHGITTFAGGHFGVDWEERKIKEYMEKDNKNNR
ncbi:2TM domain-containing protein [bacterium LRH843]|nr:2TM domain-containing protein [bacterium LRH843]